MLENVKVANKLQIFAILPLVSLLFLAWIELSEIKTVMIENRMEKTKSIVEVAHSVLKHYYDYERKGIMSRQQAQKEALDAIQYLRYEGEEYFWVNDMQPNMIMHPFKPQLNGKDISGVKDPDGVALFIEMVNVVKKEGGGFVEYKWPKPGLDEKEPVPKISYVSGFAPWGWIIGSGLYVDDVGSSFAKQLYLTFGYIILSQIVIGFLAFTLARSIAVPVNNVASMMRKLAAGEDVDVEHTERKDELGDMTRALVFLREKNIEAKRLESDRLREQTAKEERQKKVDELTSMFEEFATGSTEAVARAAKELSDTAQSMLAASERTKQETDNAAYSANLTAQNVSSVASATEELSASVKEISEQVDKTLVVVKNTVTSLEEADATSKRLAESAHQIGEVINLIRDIADQINLLALNATIESARAGEAGKGFAVVASEVKNLANETSKATDRVEEQISNIQVISDNVVKVLENIVGTVNTIENHSASVAGAMEEQDSVTASISSNMQNASAEVGQINDNISNVQNASEETKNSSSLVYESSKDLYQKAEEIKERTQEFLRAVRSA